MKVKTGKRDCQIFVVLSGNKLSHVIGLIKILEISIKIGREF